MKFLAVLILLFSLKSNAGQDGGGNFTFYYGSEKIAKRLFQNLGEFDFSSTTGNTILFDEFNKAQKKYYPNLTDKAAKKIYQQFNSAITGYSIDRLAILNTGSSNWFELVKGKIVVTTGFLQHFDRLNISVNPCEYQSLLTNLYTTAFGSTSLSHSMQIQFSSEMARESTYRITRQYPNCTEAQLTPASLPYKTCHQMTNDESSYARANLARGQQELINKLNKPWAQDLLNRASLLVFSPHKPEEISIQSLVELIKNIELKPCQRKEVTKENYWDTPVTTAPYLLTMDYRVNEDKITVLEPFFSLYRTKDLSESNLDKIQVELLHEALHIFGIGTARDGISDHGSRRLARGFVIKGELQFLPCGRQDTQTKNLLDCETSLETAKNYGIRSLVPHKATGWKLLGLSGTLYSRSPETIHSELTEDILGQMVKSYDVESAYINVANNTVITVKSSFESISTPTDPIGKILRRGPIYTSAKNAKYATYSDDLDSCQRRGRKFGIQNQRPPTGTKNSLEISQVLDFHYNEIWTLNAPNKWPKSKFEREWNYNAPFRYTTWIPEMSSSQLLYDMDDNEVHSMDEYTNNNSLGLGQNVCISAN